MLGAHNDGENTKAERCKKIMAESEQKAKPNNLKQNI
jgi:hypothetical protein